MNINRRDFVSAAALTFAAAACGCSATPENSVGPNRFDSNGPSTIDIGTVADYPRDCATDQFARSDGIIVVRKDRKIYAMSAICTHQSCILATRDMKLCCPCHGSRFDLAGNVIHGPARESLCFFGISQSKAGRLVVPFPSRKCMFCTAGSIIMCLIAGLIWVPQKMKLNSMT